MDKVQYHYMRHIAEDLRCRIGDDQSHREPSVSCTNPASSAVLWSRSSVSVKFNRAVIPRGCLKLAIREAAGFQACDLLRRERWLEEVGRVGVAAKHVGDEVNAIGKIGPVDLARITRAVRCGIYLREQSNQTRIPR